MRKKILEYLRCIRCGRSGWDLETGFETAHEIREGKVKCRGCGHAYEIHEGLLDMLGSELPEEVAHEKEHAESHGYVISAAGEKCPVNRDTITRFKDVFLSLPTGDGSHFFQPGGSFDNQAGNAGRFFRTLDLLKLTGRERVLEVGASFGWSCWRFAQRGCEAIALDVTNYPMAADLYFEKDGSYFERVMADMSTLPFADKSLDLIFSHSVIHHCKDLKKLFAEFRRVLRPGGRVAALHECAFGLLEDKSGKALQEAIEEGFNENAYTLPQWKKGALQGGFRKVDFHFFSLVEDYIHRKELRRAPVTAKLRAAYWLRRHPRLENLLNQLSIWPRIILRPKSWMMVATCD